MRKQLRDGLILRSLSEGHASDRERLPQFYFDVFNEDNEGAHPEEEKLVKDWTRDLMGKHPTTTLDDIFVVVDPAHDDKIVSATLLIPQVWRYEDVEIPVGRPELVATDKDYRRRGLVRALFDAVHERSAALGHNVLGITGIANYYRQFGYTMAVDLGQHGTLNTGLIKPIENPHFTLRPATEADIPDLVAWARYYARERLLSTVYDEQQWRHELSGRRLSHPYLVIVNQAGEGVGYLEMGAKNFHQQVTCWAYVVGDKASYLETFNDAIYGVKLWAAERFGECPPVLAFNTGIHETLSALIDRTPAGLIRRREYAWYLRIADHARFIRDITPILERRLVDSGANRYTGTLSICFYDKTGLTIQFEGGCIKDVSVGAMHENKADISFPNNLFLNVIFGYRTADEIREILPEVWANPKASVLLPILFPKSVRGSFQLTKIFRGST